MVGGDVWECGNVVEFPEADVDNGAYCHDDHRPSLDVHDHGDGTSYGDDVFCGEAYSSAMACGGV